MVFEFAGDAILRETAEIFWRTKNTIHSKIWWGGPEKRGPPHKIWWGGPEKGGPPHNNIRLEFVRIPREKAQNLTLAVQL